MNRFLVALLAGSALLTGAGAASAAAFGPATASLGSFDVPTVSVDNGTVTFNGGSDQLSAGTGTLLGIKPTGDVGTDTIYFSTTVGTIVTAGNNIADLFDFTKGVNTYIFDLTSVQTTSFSYAPGVSSVIGLYLLGEMFSTSTNPGLSPSTTGTPTSITLSFNSTGASAYSESGSLANPPSAVIANVPEPASMAIFGAGLVGTGLVRRLRRQG